MRQIHKGSQIEQIIAYYNELNRYAVHCIIVDTNDNSMMLTLKRVNHTDLHCPAIVDRDRERRAKAKSSKYCKKRRRFQNIILHLTMDKFTQLNVYRIFEKRQMHQGIPTYNV